MHPHPNHMDVHSPGISGNAGQMCIAGSRIFVQEGVYEQFIAKFSAVAEATTVSAGDTFDAWSTIPHIQYDVRRLILLSCCALLYTTHSVLLDTLINSGKEAGSEIACGGERIGETGYYI